jgi:hypothetical protein
LIFGGVLIVALIGFGALWRFHLSPRMVAEPGFRNTEKT